MATLGYTADFTDPANLLPALYSYPEMATAAAWQAAQAQLQPATNITVTVYSNVYQLIGVCGDYISLEAEFKRNDMGTATFVLKSTDPLVPYVMACTTTVVPITIQSGDNMRWSGRVNSYAYALDNRETTVTVECIDDFAWFSRMLVWPNFLLPIEFQFPSNAVFVGPACNVVLTMVSEQAFRLQTGLWEFLNNPINTALGAQSEWDFFLQKWQAAGMKPTEMLLVPIVVQFIDPIYDTSPWVAVTGRMDKIFDLVKDLLMNYGLSLTATLWLPGDPQPGAESLGVSFIPLRAELTSPAIIVRCVDRSGVTGPSGTMVSGLIKDVVDIADSTLGQSLSPLLNPKNEYFPADLGVNIAPVLGVNFVPSWVIFNADLENANGLLNYKLTGYHPLAHTAIGGGKSPQWLDDLINSTLEFLIDAIEITVGFTGIPDDLLNGTFDDIILAFQQMENFQRRAQLGPFGFPEYFTKTGASAYTVDEWFALLQAMFDTEGYNCVQLTWENGFPYTVGQDVFLGGLVSFVLNQQMYTDYVYQIKLKDDRKDRAQVEVIVGNGKREVNPMLRVVRMITGLQEVVNVITLASGG